LPLIVVATAVVVTTVVVSIVVASMIAELIDCMAGYAGDDTIARLAACD
jgi:hypothetical protein